MRSIALFPSLAFVFVCVLGSGCGSLGLARLETKPQFKALTPDRQQAVKHFIPSPGYSRAEVQLALGRPHKVSAFNAGDQWKYYNYQGIMPPTAIDPRYSNGDEYILVLTFEHDMVIKAEIETTRDPGTKVREENQRWSEKR